MVLTTFSILSIFKICYIFFNFQNLTGCHNRATFSPPQISQNLRQQKFCNFSNWHSRSRGVAKTIFGTPMLHGSHFFLIPMQHGNANSYFFNTSAARMRFVSFCRHVPSEKLRNDENASFESLLRCHVAKHAERKSSQKPIPALAGSL